MKHLLSIILALLALPVAAQTTYFGYAPMTEDADHLSAIGTGKSNTLDAAICLNPETDPVVARLKGQKILGLRVFVRANYTGSQQASNRYIFWTNSLDATPTKVTTKFNEGWNEVMFADPVSIGDEPIYLGARIYETFGTPYPFCAYRGAVAPNGYYIRAGKDNSWTTESENGVLLIQAILEDNATLTAADGPLSASAHVSFSDTPLTVRPDSPMTGSLYLHNQSAQPINNLTFTSSDNYGITHTYTLDLSENPLPAFDGRTMDYPIYAPSQEGTAQPLTLSVSAVNGAKAEGRSISYTGHYYVMRDAYTRIPLVEEFTSMFCVNCPMMAYYLDRAIQQWHKDGNPLVYLTHHVGFVNDVFTQTGDADLLYLFGPAGDTFNPACMYDRRVFEDDDTPIHSAQVAETSVYTECIEAVNNVAALADVNISLSDDQKTVTVSGTVNRNFAAENIPVYLNCYIVEDSIPTDPYTQEGLDTEGAPSDLASSYRHNGVERHSFTNSGIGKLIDIQQDTDECTYSVTFPMPEKLSPLPILDYDNTDIVAFLHIYDSSVMQNNYVLNAGSLKLSGGKLTGIQSVSASKTNEGWYNLSGQKVSKPSHRGIYLHEGKKVIR